MRENLSKRLVRDFPLTYAKSGRYFECDDGWYKLIRSTSQKLETVIAKLPLKERRQWYVTQVKEKFARLRIYMSKSTDETWDIRSQAEEASAKICEGCGKPGKKRWVTTWMKTLCSRCYAKYKKQYSHV